MPEYPIKLGREMSMPMSPEMSESDDMHYPCLYLEWDEKYDLPESGEMTIRFQKRSETNREDQRGTHQSVELDVTDIMDMTPDKKSKKENTGDMLDKYKDEVTSKK